MSLWKDHYGGKEPGDSIDGKPVLKAPQEWWKIAWDHWEEQNSHKDLRDSDLDHICEVYSLGHGDCVSGIREEIEGERFPYWLKWVVVKLNHRDADLLYLIPFMESDPYGRITDDSWEDCEHGLSDYQVFVEDTERQDHIVIFPGDGRWIHRIDLLGSWRESTRDQLVKPARKSLAEMVGQKI